MYPAEYKTGGGFRIREMIIVAVLVLILVFVALPRWAKRDTVKDSAISFRNLQQWGIALNLYLIDNNQQLPQIGSKTLGSGDETGWYNVLPPYLSLQPLANIAGPERPQPRNASIWVDPSIEKKPPGAGTFFSYAMNRYLQPRVDRPSLRIFNVLDPGRVIFLGETSGYDPALYPETLEFRHPRSKTDPTLSAHVLFCDGHVERITETVLTRTRELPAGVETTHAVFWPPTSPVVEPDRYQEY